MIDERTRFKEHLGENVGHGDGRLLFFNERSWDKAIFHLGGRAKPLRSDVAERYENQPQKEKRKQYKFHLSIALSFFFLVWIDTA